MPEKRYACYGVFPLIQAERLLISEGRRDRPFVGRGIFERLRIDYRKNSPARHG